MARVAGGSRVLRALPGFPTTEPYLTTAGAWALVEAHTNATVDTAYAGISGPVIANFPDMKGLSVRVGWCDLWKHGTTTFDSTIWDYGRTTYAVPNSKLFQTRFMMGVWTPEAAYNQYGARAYQPSTANTTTVTGTNNIGATSLVVVSSAGYTVNQCIAIGWGGGNQEFRTVDAIPDGTHLTLASGLVNQHLNAEAVTTVAPVPFDAAGNADVGLRAAYNAFLPAQVAWHINNSVKWMHLSHYGRDFAEINGEAAIAALSGYGKAAFETAMFNLISDAYVYANTNYPTQLFLEIPQTGFGNATDSIGTIDNDLIAWAKNTLTASTTISTTGGNPGHIAIGTNNLDGNNPGAGSGWNNFYVGHHAQMVGTVDYDWMGQVWQWIQGKDSQGRSRVVHSIEIYHQSWQAAQTHVANGELARFCTLMKNISHSRQPGGSRVAA